jgi:hypothetical protein
MSENVSMDGTNGKSISSVKSEEPKSKISLPPKTENLPSKQLYPKSSKLFKPHERPTRDFSQPQSNIQKDTRLTSTTKITLLKRPTTATTNTQSSTSPPQNLMNFEGVSIPRNYNGRIERGEEEDTITTEIIPQSNNWEDLLSWAKN